MDQKPVLRVITMSDWKVFAPMRTALLDEVSKESFKRRVEKGGFFGLFLGSTMVGYTNLNLFGDDEGHFQGIFIKEEHRGKGFSNLLMEHSFRWYKEQGVKKIHLYTEVDNHVAQNLYRKFGLSIDSRAWHFVVPFVSLKPLEKYTCHEIAEEDIDLVGDLFERLPAGEIRRWLASGEILALTLKDNDRRIEGACLFTREFPGCRPFEIQKVECFDDFIIGIKSRSLSEFDYVRIVFAGNESLARLCKERGYELVHEMFYFTHKFM
jgi:GNAT superfamily N-acetyltransferase